MRPLDRARFLTWGSFLFVAALIASSCQPEQLTPIDNPECVTGPPPTLTRSFVLAREYSSPYLLGVVLVAAAGDEADAAIDEVIRRARQLNDPQFVSGESGEPLYDEVVVAGVVVRLYGYNPQVSVWDVVDLILEAALDLSRNVIASPDWILGDPWPVEGSPWPVEGGPWPVEGSPTNGDEPWEDRGIYTRISENQFWAQWSWTQIAGPNHAYQMPLAGTTQVVVLDTSPFEEAGEYRIDFADDEDFILCASHPEDMETLEEYDWASDGSLEQHGFAVAGAIRTLAPSASIHLIRVLDAEASGDLLALLKGLAVATLRWSPSDGGLVINMSLGFPREAVTFPAGAGDGEECPEAQPGPGVSTECKLKALTAALDAGMGTDCANPEDDTLTLLAPLCLVIEATADRGVVFVAAAGNGYRQSADLPADWPGVLGVGATNKDGEPSCYSNMGEVWAPGGEGWQISANDGCPPDPPPCDLNNIQECGHGVVTLALVNHGLGGFQKGVQYSFWTGSSFAAPDVSAMAACLLEKGYAGGDAMAEILRRFGGTVLDFRYPLECFPR